MLDPGDATTEASFEKHDDDFEYLTRTLFTLRNYQTDAINHLSYKQRYLTECVARQKQILLDSGFGSYLENIMNCIDANQCLLNDIYACAEAQLEEPLVPPDEASRKVYRQDHLRLQELLGQVVREWSRVGQTERDESFKVMLGQLEELYPSGEGQRDKIRVLVPGSGLGRLPFEAACLGFDVLALSLIHI